jgi:hypothetical protein
MTPTEARALADTLKERFGGTVPTSQAAAALRAFADQVEALEKDAERYQVCRNQSSAEFIIQDRVNSLLTLTPQGVDDACDRAREAITPQT